MAPRSNPILRQNVIAAAGEPGAADEKAGETRRYDFSEMSKALPVPGPELTIKKRPNPVLLRNVIAAARHQKLEPSVTDEKAEETRRYDFCEMSKALSGADLTIKNRSNPIRRQKSEPMAADQKAYETHPGRRDDRLRMLRVAGIWRTRYLQRSHVQYDWGKVRGFQGVDGMITAGATVFTPSSWRRQVIRPRMVVTSTPRLQLVEHHLQGSLLRNPPASSGSDSRIS